MRLASKRDFDLGVSSNEVMGIADMEMHEAAATAQQYSPSASSLSTPQ